MQIRSARAVAAFAGLLLALSTLSATPAAAECETEVSQVLQELQVPQDDVQSVNVVRRGMGGKSPTNYSLDAMVRLKSCSGNLVINMTRYCMVRQTYTTGDCAVGGMSNY